VTPWDNNLYAFLGEVVQGHITMVAFPAMAFNVIEDVPARTEDFILEHLPELNGLEIFPPITATEQHAAEVSTRYLMYLPDKFVPYLLDSRGYTIKQVWDILYPKLIEDDVLATATPLLAWL